MENATKALIIAGSVLIAIVLIAIGIKILSSTSNVTKQVDDTSKALEISVFNSQFLQYEGEQNKSQIRALLNLIRQVNTNKETKNQITIKYSKEGEAQDYDAVRSNINMLSNFERRTISFDYDEAGYINTVIIEASV